MSERGGFVRASEVGEYVYCARAWRLRREGFAPSAAGRERLDAGTRWHLAHGAGVGRARLLRRLSMAALLLSAALAALLVLLWWRG
jgi:hypothetical protein